MIMHRPKIFVGTLYSGENELDECCERINRQTYRNFEHFIYRDLSNKEAHDTLYSDFLGNNDFDILVKIDADTVLREDSFFEKVVNIFEENPNIDLIEFVVYDFFEQVINLGLNCYRQGFSIIDKGGLFTDRITDIPKERRMISNYVSSTHCPNPSDYQAFHFGCHAQLKKRNVSVRNTFWAYLKSWNKSRGMAVCGAIKVLDRTLDISNNSSYQDETIRYLTEKYSQYGSQKLLPHILSRYVFYRTIEFAQRLRRFFSRLY